MAIDVSDLDPARIAAAAEVIDPVFLHSPQYVDVPLSQRLGRRILIKDETCNPLRSFKGRGADYLASGIGGRCRHLVCASSGNFGQAIAYVSRRRGYRCSVFLAGDANPLAQERIRGLGAEVRLIDGDDAALEDESLRYASAAPDRMLVTDGLDAAIAEGAGTIGLELLAAGPLDAVLAPVGDGALISGLGCAIKHHAPGTRVIGVCPASAPSMAESWRRGVPTSAPAQTIASGLAIVHPVARSVHRMRAFVDDIVLVSESGLVDGMRLSAKTLGTLLEPSGASGIAALLEHDLPGERIAVVLTGSVLRPEQLALVVDASSPSPC